MKYRKFGSLEWESSILGFGAAKLPLSDSASTPFDETASIEIIHRALERGVNYLDLGYPVNLERQKRITSVISEALQDGYRERAKVAITIPSHLIYSSADFDLLLDQQLVWLQMDRIDFCLMGRLNRENWPILRDRGALNWADASINSGRIGNIGFSFHDHFQVLRRILSAYDRWSLCQFQFSYMDLDHDPGVSGVKYAARNGLAVAITESLRSGRLIRKPPDLVAKTWGDARDQRRLTEYGLRFVWNYPEVSTVIRNISSIPELEENAAIADNAEPDSLTMQEEVLIGRVIDAYRELRRIPCSSCRPCMPCPEGIDVPRIFELYNDAFIYEDLAVARSIYRNELHQADRCNRCGDCQKRCVKQLDVADWLDQAHRLLSGS